ncbi:MAG TPA: hypothetical protein VE397_15575 [Stellaceae bacterium]|nr:hypothetical protein [Stellaceae bacterium]
MSKMLHAFAVDHGTLHFEVDLDLRTLAAAAAFLALLAAEIAVVLTAPARDLANQIFFTT